MQTRLVCGLGPFLLCALLPGCERSTAPTATVADSPGPAAPPSLAPPVPGKGLPIFSEHAADTGLVFRHFSAGSTRYYFPEIMGAGVGLLDYDDDGDLDVIVAQGQRLSDDMAVSELRNSTPDWPVGDRLFRNELVPAGTLAFTDVTADAAIDSKGYSMGIATGDVDNDGHVDIYITRFGSNTLLRNRGDRSFEDMTLAAGVDDERWNSGATFVDYDLDGDLDLFVAAYVGFTLRFDKTCAGPDGGPDYCSPKAYQPLVDRLFRNDGNGHFDDVTTAAGLGGGVGSGLGAVFDDYNGDGLPDLYVANDGNPNFLWLNQGDGTFTEGGLMAGAAYNRDGRAEASMGVVSGDYDNDGDPDLFMTHLRGESNTLYLNNGEGVFRDASGQHNLTRASMPLTGFGTVWIDYDNNGWLDLYIANGAVVSPDRTGGRTDQTYSQPDQFYLNDQGRRFENISDVAGAAVIAPTIGRGVAKGDIDNDGDLDLVISDNNGPLRLLLNDVGQAAPSLRVRLRSNRGNRLGIGARVGLRDNNGRVLWRRMRTDGSYLSANEAVVHFGVPATIKTTTVVVQWPDGQYEAWSGIRPSQLIMLEQGTGSPYTVATQQQPATSSSDGNPATRQ